MLPDRFRSLYPFPSHFLNLGGLRYHYLDEGAGEALVLLHGNPSWSLYYRALVQALRPAYRAVVPDHIGMGLSDKPGDTEYSYTLQRRVEDLEALLKHLGLEKDLTLVLHDWGGMIGMAYAARHPEAIRRLVVLNTSAFRLPETKPFPWQLWLTRTPLGALLVRGCNAFSRAASRACVRRKPMPPLLREAYAFPYDSWRNRIATLRFVQDIPLRPGDKSFGLVLETEQALARFRRLPMLICWGMRDFVFDFHFLEGWTARFPEAEVHRFEDCGHYILEDAAEELIPAIREFLLK